MEGTAKGAYMADLTITYNNPDFPDDAEFDVAGVGPIKNGGQLTISEETQAIYESNYGVPLADALAENPCIDTGKASSKKSGGDK